jgi:ABC-type arginine transport system ATPase subunit
VIDADVFDELFGRVVPESSEGTTVFGVRSGTGLSSLMRATRLLEPESMAALAVAGSTTEFFGSSDVVSPHLRPRRPAAFVTAVELT